MSSSSSPRALILDDERTVRLALTQALEDMGWTADSVSVGDSALQRLQQTAYGVLLLDLRLPGTSGFEVLRRVQEAYPALPVVILTAYGSIEQAIKAMRLGAADFLHKPVSLDALRKTIGRISSRPRLVTETASGYAEWMALAKQHIKQQRFDAAQHCLEAATAEDPSQAEAYTLLGILHAAEGRLNAAQTCYRRAVDRAPESAVPRIHLDQLASGRQPLFLDQASREPIKESPSGSSPPSKDAAPSPARRRVLVGLNEPVDDTWSESDRLLVQAAAASAVAHRKGDLLVQHVLEVPRQLSPSQAATAYAEKRKRLQNQLKQIGSEVASSMLAVHALVVVGHDVASVLQNTVEAENIQHVILGCTGNAGLGNAGLGRTARRVAQKVACALTLIRPGTDVWAASPAERHVAAFVNESPHASFAVRRAVECAQQAGVASVALINVQRRGEVSVEALQRRGQRIIWTVAERAGLQEGQYVPRVVLASDPEEALLEAAASYNTVCLGASRNTTFTEAIFGSLLQRLLAATQHTVVIARAPTHTARTFFDALGDRLWGA